FTTQAYYQLSTFFGSGTSDTISNLLGADVGIPLGKLMALKGGYEFSYTSVSGNTSSDTTSGDTTGNLFWASIARQISPLGALGVSTSYQLQSARSTRIWNGSLFGAYELAGRLALSASAGYSYLTSDAGRNFSAFSTNSSLSYTLAKAIFAVAVFQDFNQTF